MSWVLDTHHNMICCSFGFVFAFVAESLIDWFDTLFWVKLLKSLSVLLHYIITDGEVRFPPCWLPHLPLGQSSSSWVVDEPSRRSRRGFSGEKKTDKTVTPSLYVCTCQIRIRQIPITNMPLRRAGLSKTDVCQLKKTLFLCNQPLTVAGGLLHICLTQ